jgi:hypothetical protein
LKKAAVYVLLFVIYGLIALAATLVIAWLLGRNGWAIDGARIFIGLWLIAALLNGVVGVFYAQVPLLNEAAAFVVIFGIPAAVAFYLSRRRGFAE